MLLQRQWNEHTYDVRSDGRLVGINHDMTFISVCERVRACVITGSTGRRAPSEAGLSGRRPPLELYDFRWRKKRDSQ